MFFKRIFKPFLIWRTLLFLVAVLAAFLIPLRSGYTLQTENFSWSNLAQMWANFDCRHYLSLAEHGYSFFYTEQLFSFFPFYPFLVRTLTSITGCYLASGLIISHLAFILGLYFLYRLINLDFKKKTTQNVLLLLLVFPTSFLFTTLNAESVYFLLVILTFYLARKKQLLPAAILAALASVTKFSGIFLWPALIVEFWHHSNKSLRKLVRRPSSLFLLLPPLGLFFYVRYLALQVGNPLAFLLSRPDFAPRFTAKITLIYQVFFRYLKMIFTLSPADPIYFTIILEILVGALFLILIILSLKKVRFSYFVFSLLSYLVPTLTGSFSSMPRFVLPLFPAFIILALIMEKSKKKWLKPAYIIISLILAVISVALYTRGYFVA